MTEPSSPEHLLRLKAVRSEIAKHGYDGFLVPMADEYQSEYVPASAQRIAFLTGFTGSAGFLILTGDKAAFFTDGRYTLQAEQQLSNELFSVHDSAAKSPFAWLSENVAGAMKIAYDPWLHTQTEVDRFEKELGKSGSKLVAVEENLVDATWHTRPEAPSAPIYAYDVAYAGKSSADKRAAIAADLMKANCFASVITDPASIAWLLNIRGSDVPNTPLPLSFLILKSDGSAKWFVDPRKVTSGLGKVLGPSIDIEHPEQFPHALDRLIDGDKRVRINPGDAASWIVSRLKAANAQLDIGEDPCVLPKACKNPIELEGTRSAHRRDGAALVKFFAWLDRTVTTDVVTEISAEEKLSAFRKENKLYRGPSFDTISGAGSHGAIVHYKATKTSDRRLEPGQLYLLDSGGQYMDGTTDVTRTVLIGSGTFEMRDRFTRVLKGHIALSSVRFPEGTTGAELDVLARQFLWAIGCDYSHGTGHGVGCYLGVHEGPQGISKRNKVPLQVGMILSNEPGYYKTGQYGIRIENLVSVVENADLAGNERKMFGFEPLTLCPIDRRLMELTLLSSAEIDWINAYHERVRETLMPLIDEMTGKWLTKATAPL